MKKFAYRNTTTVAGAASLLKAGNAAILAGGTDILNLLKTGALTHPPETLVNIKNIPGLNSITKDVEGLTIGEPKIFQICKCFRSGERGRIRGIARAAGNGHDCRKPVPGSPVLVLQKITPYGYFL